jgi:hypothetical protein
MAAHMLNTARMNDEDTEKKMATDFGCSVEDVGRLVESLRKNKRRSSVAKREEE